MRGGALEIDREDRYRYNITEQEMSACEAGSPPGTDEFLRCQAHEEGKRLLSAWLSSHDLEIQTVLALFDFEGKPKEGLITATAFNDLYKWTMMPVMRQMEKLKGGCTVTFGIDLRDESMRKALKEDPALVEAIHTALTKLKDRKFDREVFTRAALIGPRTGLLTEEDITAICGPAGSPRSLVDHVPEFGDKYVAMPSNISDGKVVVAFYENKEAEYKPGEKGVHFIEATGPWHRVTWLETSMMQCVYEAKLRYDLEKKRVHYGQWLYGALLRCAKSVAYTRMIQKMAYAEPPAAGIPPPMTPALFTGRRTGGMAFLLLQNLFFAHHFRQTTPPSLPKMTWTEGEQTWCLGTSSCDANYILKGLGLKCLNPAGTHAHELSMVSSALFPHLDKNDEHLPLTQVLGHYMYMKLVWEKTGKAGPLPMLSDTLGTRAFLRAAKYVTVDGVPFLNHITSARQDSGKLADFRQNMMDFGYVKPDGNVKGMMASEIDDSSTLLEAATLGYASFGAGGFYGDSEKVWGDKNASSNSMAVKAVRVSYQKKAGESYAGIPYMVEGAGGRVTGYPVKIGDPSNGADPRLAEGKLSLDKNRSDLIPAIKAYAESVRVAGGRTGDTPVNIGTVSFDDLLAPLGIVVASPAVGGYRRSKQQRRTRQRQQRQRQKQSRRQRQ